MSPLLRRLATSVALLLLVLSTTFALLHAAPGDPAALADSPRLDSEARQLLRQRWGLDRPIAEQYARWLGSMLRGDWGFSFLYQRAVLPVVAGTLPASLLLGSAALLIALGAGLGLGVVAARWPGRWPDQLTRWVSLLLYSAPTFWLGLLAILCFAVRWPLFPPGQASSVGAADGALLEQLFDRLHHLALPALVLGLSYTGLVARFARNTLLETLASRPLFAYRARGLPEHRIWLHAFRLGAGPLIQLLGSQLPALLGGSLIIEVLFSWPGLGRLAYDALLGRDYPLVLGTTMCTAVLAVVGNLLADLLHRAADPRVADA